MCLKNTRTNRTVSFRLQRLTVAQISFIFRHTARVLWLWVIRIGRPCLQVPYLDKIVTFPRLLPMRPLSSEINTESSLRCLPRFIRFSLESCKLICAYHRKGTTLLMIPMLHFLCLIRLTDFRLFFFALPLVQLGLVLRLISMTETVRVILPY